jgi:hypothetical protein
MEAILKGPLSDRLFNMVQKQVQRSVDERAGLAKPFVVLAVGSTRYPGDEAHDRPEGHGADARDHAAHRALRGGRDGHPEHPEGKMREVTPTEFESLLRPAFQQDEWILIAVGTALGFLVGELQVFLMLHH